MSAARRPEAGSNALISAGYIATLIQASRLYARRVAPFGTFDHATGV